METIEAIQNNFIQAFNEIGDWILQYEFLLQIAAELEEYPADRKDERHLIPGCQSKLWIYCEKKEDRLHIWCDSEALIIKGMIAVAIFMFQDQKMTDIQNADVRYITYTDIKNQISTDRFRGLESTIQMIQTYHE